MNNINMLYYVELKFLKVLMLIRQGHQMSAIFATIATFQVKGLSFNRMSTMVATMY